jgi:acid phosphatase family membrane protein YuiD
VASLALAFDILARDRASKTFDKVGDSADRAGKRGKSFGTAMKAGVGLAAGALAAVGLSDLIGKATAAVSDSIAEAREAQKVGAITRSIIKSTGGAAKVSAAQVEALAESISVKAGVDDEAIQTGSNLLLTFKNVRNEVGKGNDVFNRATQAAVDLSAAGFGSIESGSKMLGKALNDPIKGITALSRAGVTFTDQQKSQIKTLVASGKSLEAQKIILKEVESQVGGTAAASATMGDKVKVAVGNMKEAIGAQLLPVLDKLGAWFLNKGLPALQRFGGWITGKLWPALMQGYRTILPGVQQALAILTGGVNKGSVSWRQIGDVITTKVIPFLAQLFRIYLPAVARNIRICIDVVTTLWRVFMTGRDIIARVVSFILGQFASLSRTWAGVLRALGRVPGFGWATDAAAKLDKAAGKAQTLARNIGNIPSNKTVTIDINSRVMSSRVKIGNEWVNVGLRAAGGPVFKGQPYIVGERRPELFVPSQNGTIVPRVPTASSPGMAASAPSKTDLSEASLQRLAAILSQTTLGGVTVSAGTVDRAIGGTLR